MAEKEKVLERTYIIPLRRYYLNTQPYLRAKKSMSLIRVFLKKHMKADEVKLGQELNELIWARGGKKVPGKVKVTAKREGKTVTANLAGLVVKEKKTAKKEAKSDETAVSKRGEKKEKTPKEAVKIEEVGED